MLRKTIFLLLIFTIVACGPGKRKRTYSKTRTVTVEGSTEDTLTTRKSRKEERKNERAEAIISTAMGYSGTRYRYGGISKKGMDCSGLIYVSLKENDIFFPRISHEMAQEGQRISVSEVQKGDLLFFKTSKRGKRVNHVGLVVDVEGDDIKFIHATTSRGVLVSSLREGYWNYAFVKAMRIL